MKHLRRFFLPWTAADSFPSQEEFLSWLRKKQRRLENLRIVFLVLAAAVLIAGYVLDRYAILLLTVVPLTAVLLLSLALSRTEQLTGGQTEPTAKE